MEEKELTHRCCLRKRYFKAKKSAKRFIKRAKKKGIMVSPSLNIYKCRFCAGWHLGHTQEEQNV